MIEEVHRGRGFFSGCGETTGRLSLGVVQVHGYGGSEHNSLDVQSSHTPKCPNGTCVPLCSNKFIRGVTSSVAAAKLRKLNHNNMYILFDTSRLIIFPIDDNTKFTHFQKKQQRQIMLNMDHATSTKPPAVRCEHIPSIQ